MTDPSNEPNPMPHRRNRPRTGAGRPHAIRTRLSDEEYELVAIAAAGAGLTPTGYVAHTAVTAARLRVRPLPATVREVVIELIEARTQLRRYGTLLNQAVAKLNATGQVTGGLGSSIERCETAVIAVRDAALRLAAQR